MRHKLGILISGGGTTMRAIIAACQAGVISDMNVGCIISSTPTAGGIVKARQLEIPRENIVVINPYEYKTNGKVDRVRFGEAILEELKGRNITVVTQNGWLPLTPENVIDAYPGFIFNQHPGPVPEFGGMGMYGRRVHAARLEFVQQTDRDWWTEAIAQRVDRNFDQGAVVKSQRIEIKRDDSIDSLQARVLPYEHHVQIALLQDVAAGKVKEEAKRGSLVWPEEEELLRECKKKAIAAYPEG